MRRVLLLALLLAGCLDAPLDEAACVFVRVLPAADVVGAGEEVVVRVESVNCGDARLELRTRACGAATLEVRVGGVAAHAWREGAARVGDPCLGLLPRVVALEPRSAWTDDYRWDQSLLTNGWAAEAAPRGVAGFEATSIYRGIGAYAAVTLAEDAPALRWRTLDARGARGDLPDAPGEPTRRVLDTREAFAAWWADARAVEPFDPPPAVDFATERVVVVGTGAWGNGCHDVAVTNVTARGDGLDVEVTTTVPGQGASCTDIAQSPRRVVAVPREGGPVAFVERTRTVP